MKLSIKLLLTLALLIVLYLAAVVLPRALGSEMNISLKRDAVRTLLLRAIQIGRFGHAFGVATNSRNGDQSVPDRVRANPISISCQDQIDLGLEDPNEVIPIVTLFLEHPYWALWPLLAKWKAVVIYQGNPADLSLVLDATNQEILFLPQARKMDGTAVPEHLRTDNLRTYSTFIKSRSFHWTSQLCDTFTYTIVEEF